MTQISPRGARYALLCYYLTVFSAVLLSPPNVPEFNARCGAIVTWIPAARRLLELSQFPTKTLVWLLSSIVAAPLAYVYANDRFSARRASDWSAGQARAIRNGVLMLALMFTPWLLLDSYRSDMHRAGVWISAMGFYYPWLALFGSVVSTIYAVLYLSAVLVVLRLSSTVR